MPWAVRAAPRRSASIAEKTRTPDPAIVAITPVAADTSRTL